MAELWSVLSNVYSPIGALLTDLGNKGPVDRVGFVVGAVLPLVLPVIAAVRQTRTTRGRLERQKQQLEEENVELEREKERLSRELEEVRSRLPKAAHDRAARERRDGNEERAVAIARARIDEDGPDLSRLAADVAGYHFAMTNGADDHLTAAERFATLALHLDPHQPEGEGLLAEAHTLRGERALSRGDLAATMREWDEIFAYADPVEATPEAIDALIGRLVALRDEGVYWHYLALARRALSLARRGLGSSHPSTLTVSFYYIDALMRVGQYATAMVEVEFLIPIRNRVSGAEHLDAFATRFLYVSLLHELGRPAEALAETEKLLSIEERVSGTEDINTLATRHLYAFLLGVRGNYAEGLTVIEALLPVTRRVLGAEHDETLSARHLKASLHRSAGDPAAARAELLEVCVAYRTSRGVEHPKALKAAFELGLAERDVGNLARAKRVLGDVLAGQELKLGSDHPDTRETRQALAGLVAQADAPARAASA